MPKSTLTAVAICCRPARGVAKVYSESYSERQDDESLCDCPPRQLV